MVPANLKQALIDALDPHPEMFSEEPRTIVLRLQGIDIGVLALDRPRLQRALRHQGKDAPQEEVAAVEAGILATVAGAPYLVQSEHRIERLREHDRLAILAHPET